MKANTPQSAPRAPLSADTASGVHAHKDLQDSNKSEPVASSHSPNRRVRHSPRGPSRRCPGGRGEPGGGREEKLPPLARALSQSTRGRRGSPRGCAGGQSDAGCRSPPDGEAVPAAGVAPPAGVRGRRAGARSSPFPRPLPCPLRARQPWPLARPAGAPPSLSCGASALSSSCHYSGQDPSSEQASPSPARKCGGGGGV